MQSYNVVRIISLWRLLKITLTEASVAYCMTSTHVTYWSHCFKRKCILLVRNIWTNSVFQNSIPKKVFFGSIVCNLNEEKPLPRKWLPKFSEVFERTTFWNMCRLTCFQLQIYLFQWVEFIVFLRDLYKLISVYLKGFKQVFCNSNLILMVNFNGIVKLYEFMF